MCGRFAMTDSSEKVMKDIEEILKPTLTVDKFRESLINKLASRNWLIESLRSFIFSLPSILKN